MTNFQDTDIYYVHAVDPEAPWDRDYDHEEIAEGVFLWPLLSLVAIIGASLMAVWL